MLVQKLAYRMWEWRSSHGKPGSPDHDWYLAEWIVSTIESESELHLVRGLCGLN